MPRGALERVFKRVKITTAILFLSKGLEILLIPYRLLPFIY